MAVLPWLLHPEARSFLGLAEARDLERGQPKCGLRLLVRFPSVEVFSRNGPCEVNHAIR